MITSPPKTEKSQTDRVHFTWRDSKRPPEVEKWLVVDQLDVSEFMSGLFHMQVRLFASRENASLIEPAKMIGKSATLRLNVPKGHRFFNGLITHFGVEGANNKRVEFSAVLSPWLSLLMQTSDCRVFQKMNTIDIVDSVLGDLKAKFPHLVDYSLEGVRELGLYKRDYCVQYNETDFNFFSRLIEEVGLYYYFAHEDGRHKLVLGDSPQAYRDYPLGPFVRFLPDTNTQGKEDCLTSWSEQQSLISGKHAHRDYNFLASAQRFEETTPTKLPLAGNDQLEIYRYPGGHAAHFKDPAEDLVPDIKEISDLRGGIRMQADEVGQRTVWGNSYCRGFAPGMRFQRRVPSNDKNDPWIEEGEVFVLTAVHHSVWRERADGNGKNTHALNYHNSFTCIPTTSIYRRPPTTQKPIIHGVQTAEVVGPDGPQTDEEIYVDEWGRVRVQFHWDRYGTHDNASSCWVRVAQLWAGKQWGVHFWPRIGHEVVVAFEEGDPDRPIIVGSVYNDRNEPPYTLPEHATRSGIKSRSSKDGTGDNFNELRFEDRKGQEEVYLHAERSLKTVVESSESRSVGASRDTTVGQNETLTIKKGNRTTLLEEGNDRLTIEEGNRESILNQGNDRLTLNEGSRDTRIAQGNEQLAVEQGDLAHQVPLGEYRIEAKQMVVSCSEKIILSVGSSALYMDGESLFLQVGGTTVKLDLESIQSNALKIGSTALGTHQIQGLPVMVNC